MGAIARAPGDAVGRRGQAAVETALGFVRCNEVPLRWVDLDPLAELLSREEVESAVQPVALFADGSRLEAPANDADPMLRWRFTQCTSAKQTEAHRARLSCADA
jgi:hypothetical protein